MIAAYAYSMLGAMESSFSSMAFSNASSVWCCGPALMYVSVEPVHTITPRVAPLAAITLRMSARICSARSRLFLPVLTFVAPLMRVT